MHPSLTLSLLYMYMIMQLRSGHMAAWLCCERNFNPLTVPQSNLKRWAASRWAFSHISSLFSWAATYCWRLPVTHCELCKVLVYDVYRLVVLVAYPALWKLLISVLLPTFLCLCQCGFKRSRVKVTVGSNMFWNGRGIIVDGVVTTTNAGLHGITDDLLQWLQSVQNVAARLVTRTGLCEHIIPVLCELHWLPVRRCVEFKIATQVFKALNGLAPPYLVDDCNLVSDDTLRLRSATYLTYMVPRTRTRLGDRSFAVTGPRDWNSLPAALRAVEDYEQFKAQLKTHLFDWLRLQHLVTSAFQRRV